MKATYSLVLSLFAVWLCASSVCCYAGLPVCLDCQKPIYPVTEIFFSGFTNEAIANSLCSQYGQGNLFSDLYISEQLSFFHEMLTLETKPPMPLKVNLMAIEYCRWAATTFFTEETPEHETRKIVTAICEEFTAGVDKEELAALLDWQKDTEERALLAHNRREESHTSDRSSLRPYGTHSIIDQETEWNEQKWEDFLILRAHELLACIRADDKENYRRVVDRGDVYSGFPPALNAMADYIRKTTEEKDWTEIDKIILEYQELEQRRTEHYRKMIVGEGQ